jgi:hypothetical protein
MLSTNRRWMSRNATIIDAMASTDPAIVPVVHEVEQAEGQQRGDGHARR